MSSGNVFFGVLFFVLFLGSLYLVFAKKDFFAIILVFMSVLPLAEMLFGMPILRNEPLCSQTQPGAYGTRTGVLYAEYKDDSGQVVLVREPGGSAVK